MKIKLRKVGINIYPYGMLSNENKMFLLNAEDGDVFDGVSKHRMNYYKLANGFLVHVYNCYEVKTVTQAPKRPKPVYQMFNVKMVPCAELRPDLGVFRTLDECNAILVKAACDNWKPI